MQLLREAIPEKLAFLIINNGGMLPLETRLILHGGRPCGEILPLETCLFLHGGRPCSEGLPLEKCLSALYLHKKIILEAEFERIFPKTVR